MLIVNRKIGAKENSMNHERSVRDSFRVSESVGSGNRTDAKVVPTERNFYLK